LLFLICEIDLLLNLIDEEKSATNKARDSTPFIVIFGQSKLVRIRGCAVLLLILGLLDDAFC